MSDIDKFLDDYEDMDDNDLYAARTNHKKTHQRRFKARRKIEKLRELKRLKQLEPNYFD